MATAITVTDRTGDRVRLRHTPPEGSAAAVEIDVIEAGDRYQVVITAAYLSETQIRIVCDAGAEEIRAIADKFIRPRRPSVTPSRAKRSGRSGFTLVELLVVIVILGIVSVVALPSVLAAIRHRQVSETARLVQTAIAGAHGQAVHDGGLVGFRLVPDPQFPPARLADGSIDFTAPLAASKLLPIAELPGYSTGAITIVPPATASQSTGVNPCLMIEECQVDPTTGLVLEPSSWAWNVRVGDRLQINGTGLWYTVVGPTVVTASQGNTELFINFGPPGTVPPWNDTQGGVAVHPEYLFLVNGVDDNGNGYADEGYDGVDNNGNGVIDDNGPIDPTGKTFGEWEPEAWSPTALSMAGGQPYAIRRRPGPSSSARVIDLPTNVVIDLSRSRVPVDPYTGSVDLLVAPSGGVTVQTRYGVPTSVGLGSAFIHLWLAERSDVGTAAPTGEWAVVSVFSRTGRVVSTSNPPLANPFAAIQQGAR